MMATPQAPASSIGFALSKVIPPIPTHGKVKPSACSSATRSGPHGAWASGLLLVAYIGPTPTQSA